jgi:hypothetical protein
LIFTAPTSGQKEKPFKAEAFKGELLRGTTLLIRQSFLPYISSSLTE